MILRGIGVAEGYLCALPSCFSFSLCITNALNDCGSQRFSRCEGRQLLQGGGHRREDGGDDFSPVVGHLVSMYFGDFFQITVSNNCRSVGSRTRSPRMRRPADSTGFSNSRVSSSMVVRSSSWLSALMYRSAAFARPPPGDEDPQFPAVAAASLARRRDPLLSAGTPESPGHCEWWFQLARRARMEFHAKALLPRDGRVRSVGRDGRRYLGWQIPSGSVDFPRRPSRQDSHRIQDQ